MVLTFLLKKKRRLGEVLLGNRNDQKQLYLREISNYFEAHQNTHKTALKWSLDSKPRIYPFKIIAKLLMNR